VARRSPAPRPQRTLEEQADLRRRADAGELEAVRELTGIHHDIDDIGIAEGDLAIRAELALVDLATSTLSERAQLVRHLERKRSELDGPAPSPIERLLVDRVVTCELHLNYLEERFVEALKKGSNVEAEKHLERLVAGANRRLLQSIKTLAQVRRLLIPVVQFNMANQQVNVVAGSTLGELDSSL
jgi:hypothetical protein